MSGVRYSATELAALLGLNPPTPQQCAVIESDATSPALVVAGAGSGKTETMANRVVWLVANGLVAPEQVLGLTFTRKAAGQLGDRISRYLARLRVLEGAVSSSEFDQPTVSTYNSFASGIFRDNALRIGREPESVLVSESSAWLLARSIVARSTDERLVTIGRPLDGLAESIVELGHQFGENVADPAEAARIAERFVGIADLPYTDGKAKSAPYKSVVDAVAGVGALPALVDLAVEYAAEKKARGLVEFSDQVALALEVCERVPSVIADFRERYRVVLLDEYQDTSVVQTRLLATLFAGHGVMAVGDPHQSIYGWRGASAANLTRFGSDFGRGESVTEFPLSISWRNSRTVLAAANEIVAPLRGAGERPLEQKPGATDGAVEVRFAETLGEECSAVADWFVSTLGRDGGASAAILFRQRRHMAEFASALAERGVRHHVLGIGGLLSTPEIVDLVSALRVIADPDAGSALIRLLSGARWRIGPRDLQQLNQVAGWLHAHDWRQAALSDELKQRMRDSVAADDGRSIVDALDFVAEAPVGHSQLQGFSAEALPRLVKAGRQLAYFRSRSGLSLPELVRLVEQELLLDIEVVANDVSGLGLANLYAFHDELDGFMASDDSPTLGGFLAWLRRAERRDDMGPRSESAEAGVVQLLTIHGAKGLEWDYVALPRLVEAEIPAPAREGTGWVGFGRLPFELRGDASELPALDWRGVSSQQAFDAALTAFKAELAARHQAEERRLGYVALTRAADSILLSGSFWTGATKSRGPSRFLLELVAGGHIAAVPTESRFESDPVENASHRLQWPPDPLGSRRGRVERAVELVSRDDALAHEAGRWSRDIDLLLAERDALRRAAAATRVPVRVSASRFKDFVTDADAVSLALRRPMPERPYRATRLGTLFHSWVEARSGSTGHADYIDDLASTVDAEDEAGSLGGDDIARLRALQDTFERSPWADRKPVDVEVEIHLPFDDRVVVCKIDAVYESHGPASERRWEIVDWKTGKAPKDDADLEAKQFQLALYRLAYARWKGIDPALIDAMFYFVADDRIIRPERLFDEAELVARWRSAF